MEKKKNYPIRKWPKDEQIFHGRGYADGTQKDVHHRPAGKCKWKPQGHHTPIRRAKVKNRDNSERCRGCRDSGSPAHTFLVGKQNSRAPLETSWAVSYEAKHAITVQTNGFPLGHLPLRNENICLHKDLYRDVTGALLRIVKNGNQSRCPSIGEWPGRWNAMGILPGEKKEWTDDTNDSLESYAGWKKAKHKGYALHDSIYRTLLKWHPFSKG